MPLDCRTLAPIDHRLNFATLRGEVQDALRPKKGFSCGRACASYILNPIWRSPKKRFLRRSKNT
jgi:hypothetical protein